MAKTRWNEAAKYFGRKRVRQQHSRQQRRRLTLAQAKKNLKAQGISRRNSRALYDEWDKLMKSFPEGTLA